MATQREKRHELKTIKQERNQKIREEINRQVCKDIVKRHQDKAKELWVQHKESIQKQSSPGPAEYSTQINKFTSAFTGEGITCSFGLGPRLPANTSLFDRTLALKKLKDRKASI